MRLRKCLLTGILVGAVCIAQSDITEPEVINVFYGLVDGKLIPLERQAAAFKGGAHGFVVMSMKTAAELPGGKSPVRFKSRERIEFVVRSIAAGAAVDPNTLYALRKLDAKKKTRELVIMSGHVTPFGGSATVTPSEGVIPVDFAKYGTASYKVIVSGLPPGEYAIGRLYGPSVSCFGVD